ncbi:hypothetical protein BJX65DRAFT_235796 [Aspergillus insuetus]
MQLFKTPFLAAALATLLPVALSVSAPIETLPYPVGNGWPCSSGQYGQYYCAGDRNSIQICDRGTWRTSALCGSGCCQHNGGNGLPYCYC